MNPYSIFLVLAAILMSEQAAVQNMDNILKDIFGECDMENGDFGICVKYYQCNANNNIIDDGSNLLGERWLSDTNRRKCPNVIDVCCRNSDVINEVPDQGCGFRNPDGLGSSNSDHQDNSKPGEFPWTVVIIKKTKLKNQTTLNQYVGGGSLIHPSVVLTVAHMIRDKDLMIRAGEWDTQSSSEIYAHQDRKVAETVIHEEFIRRNLYNNIALLFLSKPLVLTPNIRPICLPKQDESASGGEMCLSSGWGKDITKKKRYTIMKKVELPVVHRNSCQSKLRTTRLSRFFKLHTSFMCAGGEVGKDMCQGDGGSPLICPITDQTNRYVQHGIVSWGIGCGEDIPGVYTDVSRFRTWIDDKLRDRGYDPSVLDY